MLSCARIGPLFALLLFTGCLSPQPDYHGTYLDPPSDPVPFELASAAGPVSLSNFEGDWLMLFFGYTHCPDICPATMSILKRSVDQLDADQRTQVQVAMISVDPERDTPERLASYVSAFDQSFIGMTGTDEQIEQITSDYGIYYSRLDASEEDGYYDVDHTAAVLLLDPHSRMRMVWSYGTTAEDIASDLRHLVN